MCFNTSKREDYKKKTKNSVDNGNHDDDEGYGKKRSVRSQALGAIKPAEIINFLIDTRGLMAFLVLLLHFQMGFLLDSNQPRKRLDLIPSASKKKKTKTVDNVNALSIITFFTSVGFTCCTLAAILGRVRNFQN